MQISDKMINIEDAISNLRGNQRQLDMDGCEVGVSRQALEEVLSVLSTDAEPVGYASDYGLGRLAKRNNYCLSMMRQPENEYVNPLYAAHPAPSFAVKDVIDLIRDYGNDALPDSEYRLACNDLIEALTETQHSALSAQVQDVAEERYRHKKRGSEYIVIARGILQVDADLDNEKVVIYRGDDGKTWVRPEYEFNDGRFELIKSTKSAKQGEEE
jgi:hypothetical protein